MSYFANIPSFDRTFSQWGGHSSSPVADMAATGQGKQGRAKLVRSKKKYGDCRNFVYNPPCVTRQVSSVNNAKKKLL